MFGDPLQPDSTGEKIIFARDGGKRKDGGKDKVARVKEKRNGRLGAAETSA